MQEAIKKAIKNGYQDVARDCDGKRDEHICLDPLFWQALCTTKFNKDSRINGYKIWLWNWHRFIDHLSEGKDAESFFKNLMK